jgi:SnoaL-like domain
VRKSRSRSFGDKILKDREETMKIRSVVALVGLAISFALPTFAQQTNTPDPQLRQALLALAKKFEDAWNNNDAVALAALFTEDAVLVEQSGAVNGREAIEKHYADLFQKVHFSWLPSLFRCTLVFLGISNYQLMAS